MRLSSVGRVLVVCGLFGLGLALSGCGGGEVGLPAVTNPLPNAGVDAPAGSNEDFIVNIGRRVYFSENSAELNEAGKDTLKLQLEWLTRYNGYKIKIEGFADEPGGADANARLGAKRAEAVRGWFAGNGFPVARMRTKTFGNTRLVTKCTDGSCSAQNRRAVTVLDTEVGS